jgi:FAD/FMN-containing dehydrogenase
MALSDSSHVLIQELKSALGEAHVVTDVAAALPFTREWRGRLEGRALCVVSPADTSQVQEVVRLCAASRVPMTVQGGNTGLMGGQVPDETGQEVVISLKRMSRIRAQDSVGGTLTVEAGVVLADAQAAAQEMGFEVPLSLASEGSCTMGGVLSTNAGGTLTLAYGNAKAMVLGLEVVLADGRLWQGLKSLRKDNMGYDLKQLFLGSEGTLGIITAASLALVPAFPAKAVAFVGVQDAGAALALLQRTREAAIGVVKACEFIPDLGLELLTQHMDWTRRPLETQSPYYVLLEVDGHDNAALEAGLDGVLMRALEDGLIADGMRAQSLEQARLLWRMRHALSEVQKMEGASIKHDISVPLDVLPAFLKEAEAACLKAVPQCRPLPFGHVGDGNIHFNISQPPHMQGADFLALRPVLEDVVHGLVKHYGGSLAAEHGVGRFKRDLLLETLDPVALSLMRSLKQALDPHGLLNPHRVI